MTGIGYELVEGEGGEVRGKWSFRVLLGGHPVKDLQTPLWFPATVRGKKAAKACAEDCMNKLAQHLSMRLRARKGGVKVFTS